MSKNPFLKLARKAVKEYVNSGRVIEPSSKLPSELLDKKAGVFVTIKKKGELRGCLGTYLPVRDNIAEEIVNNAVAACSKDHRFPPVRKEELSGLKFEVYILEEPEKVEDISFLDPKKYGVLVKKGLRSGLLLPGLEEIETPEEQLAIVCRKAGLSSSNEVEIFRFRAEKYEEK